MPAKVGIDAFLPVMPATVGIHACPAQ